MKINTKVRYGLRALVAIANSKNGILQKEIAEKQEIPLNYLDSIITGLRNSGLIVNFAGKGAGYILATSPKDISVYDVYRAFEAELLLVNCSCTSNECKRTDICPTKDFWFELNVQIKSFMKQQKLQELMDRQELRN